MKEFVLAAVQMESPLGNVNENTERIRDWMNKAAREGAQLVFFPECCLTGYSTAHADEVAIPVDNASVAEIEKHAAKLGIMVGYGFIEDVTSRIAADCFGSVRNAVSSAKPRDTYFLTGGGGRLVYEKTHLGSSEQQVFEMGSELPVADVAGVTVGVQLCWEAHIPDITTTLRAKGAELVLMPHAVGIGGARRIELWNRYLPARAYDNGLFVVACNALRRDGEGAIVGGGIVAYGPDGACCASSESSEEGMLLVRVGGVLPRDSADDEMRGVSYFDRRRPELYSG